MSKIKTITVNGKTYTVDDPDSVSFEDAQDLTEDQKRQARVNIGAISADEVETMLENAGGGNASIDDTAVGAAAWSSRNIVDRLCPAFTESGAAVSVEPVEGYPLSVVSSIAAVQEGSGNPRPAGWTVTDIGLSIGVEYGVITGALTEGTKYKLAVNATNAAGERVKLASAVVYDRNGSYASVIACEVSDYDIVFTMTLDSENTSGVAQADIQVSFAEAVDESSIWQYDEGGDVSLVDGAYVLSEYDPGNVRPITGFDSVQLTHENGEGSAQLSVDLGQTVGKGSYNWNTGVLTKEAEMITFTGAEAWAKFTPTAGSTGDMYFYLVIGAKYYAVKGSSTCSHFKSAAISANNTIIASWVTNSASGDDRIIIRPDLTVIPDVETWKAFLAEQYAAGTPVTMVYQITEPVTYQLDPTQILSLSGENTLTSSTGDTTVSGKAAPDALFDKIINAIVALGGNV